MKPAKKKQSMSSVFSLRAYLINISVDRFIFSGLRSKRHLRRSHNKVGKGKEVTHPVLLLKNPWCPSNKLSFVAVMSVEKCKGSTKRRRAKGFAVAFNDPVGKSKKSRR